MTEQREQFVLVHGGDTGKVRVVQLVADFPETGDGHLAEFLVGVGHGVSSYDAVGYRFAGVRLFTGDSSISFPGSPDRVGLRHEHDGAVRQDVVPREFV